MIRANDKEGNGNRRGTTVEAGCDFDERVGARRGATACVVFRLRAATRRVGGLVSVCSVRKSCDNINGLISPLIAQFLP